MKEPEDANFQKLKHNLNMELCKQVISVYPFSKLDYLEQIMVMTKEKKNPNGSGNSKGKNQKNSLFFC